MPYGQGPLWCHVSAGLEGTAARDPSLGAVGRLCDGFPPDRHSNDPDMPNRLRLP
jgi:hypothetical protein